MAREPPRLDDQRDTLVAVEPGQRGQRPAFDLDDRDPQARGVQDDLLERLAALRHDQQPAGRPARDERLLDRTPPGDELLVRGRAPRAAAGRVGAGRAAVAPRPVRYGGPRPTAIAGRRRGPGRRRSPAGRTGPAWSVAGRSVAATVVARPGAGRRSVGARSSGRAVVVRGARRRTWPWSCARPVRRPVVRAGPEPPRPGGPPRRGRADGGRPADTAGRGPGRRRCRGPSSAGRPASRSPRAAAILAVARAVRGAVAGRPLGPPVVGRSPRGTVGGAAVGRRPRPDAGPVRPDRRPAAVGGPRRAAAAHGRCRPAGRTAAVRRPGGRRSCRGRSPAAAFGRRSWRTVSHGPPRMRRQRWPSRVSSTTMPSVEEFIAQSIRSRPVASGSGRGTCLEQCGRIGRESRRRPGGCPAPGPGRAAASSARRGIRRRDRARLDPPIQLADQVEDGGQPGRHVEVVVQGGPERLACRRQHRRQLGVVRRDPRDRPAAPPGRHRAGRSRRRPRSASRRE